MRRLLLPSLFALALASQAAGCTDDTSDTTTTVGSGYPTSFLLEPISFLGDVPCAAVPGALQSYTATLFDITTDKPFPLPSSTAVACSATLQFRRLVAGHRYRVEIDGYDVPPGELVPVGGKSSGSRTMLRVGDAQKQPVTPRWTSQCAPLVAEQDVRTGVGDCDPLKEQGSPSSTGIRVDPYAVFAGTAQNPSQDLSCRIFDASQGGKLVGEVASLDLVPEDPALPAHMGLFCSPAEAKPGPYVQGIVPGQTYVFRVEAHALVGGPVVWGAACTAKAVEGLIVDAKCEPLSDRGTVDVGIGDALAAAGRVCAASDVQSYDVAFQAPIDLADNALPCDQAVRFGPLPAGLVTAKVTGRDKDGQAVFSTTCTATVEPGAAATATCK